MRGAIGAAYSNEPDFAGRTFYVSSGGSDSNSGLSTLSPLATIEAANYKTKSGDRVLFKGGESFYGRLYPQHDDITYGVYSPVADFVGVASIANNLLTVESKISGGYIGIGSKVTISGLRKNFFGSDLDVYVVSLGTGTGGTGTYYINPNLPDGETLAISSQVVTIGGKKPLISGNSDVALNVLGISNINIDGIVFSNDSYRVAYVNVSKEMSNFSVRNCGFFQTTGGDATATAIFYIKHAGFDFHDIQFSDNVFVGAEYTYSSSQHGILFFSSAPLYNLEVTKNTFYNIQADAFLIWHWDQATILAADAIPTDIAIEENVFSNIGLDAIGAATGLRGTTTVNKNTAYNIGTAITPNVNAIQSGYWVGTMIEENDIRNVYTNAPDGVGIIMDWAWADADYYSSDCTVRRNYISGCSSGGAAISSYKSKNTDIYSNLVVSSTTGLTYAGIAGVTTGNRFFNNTSVSCGKGMTCSGYSSIGPAPEIFNNIFIGGDYGIYTKNNALLPNEHHNLFYENTTNYYDASTSTVKSIDSSDTVADPLFASSTDFSLTEFSPARGAGIMPYGWSSLIDITGFASTLNPPDIGAYFYQ